MQEITVLQALKYELNPMSPTALLISQSVLIFLQMVSVGLSTLKNIPPVAPMLVSALLGSTQFLVQRLGNQAEPPAKRSKTRSTTAQT